MVAKGRGEGRGRDLYKMGWELVRENRNIQCFGFWIEWKKLKKNKYLINWQINPKPWDESSKYAQNLDISHLHLLFEDRQNIKWVGLSCVSSAHQNGPSHSLQPLFLNECYKQRLWIVLRFIIFHWEWKAAQKYTIKGDELKNKVGKNLPKWNTRLWTCLRTVKVSKGEENTMK